MEQLCLYKRSYHLFKRGVNQENLHEKSVNPPITGKGAVRVRTLLGII